MKSIYTFFSYLLFRFFIQKTICLELNIGKIADYSSGSTKVAVKNTTKLQNLYTHKFSNPVSLKDIYNGNKRLYFDPLLVKDQLLLSASVVWSFMTPSIVQLNLEQSSVLLINEKESLDVQAIFSEKLVTNLSPRTHSTTEVTVDVDLSKFDDYDNNNSKVYVTKLELEEKRFRRYTLRNYNLESTKLGRILYNNKELKTNSENESTGDIESNLVIPNKNNIYSVLVYSYDDFPLLIEVLYTFNKRRFYGYTDEKKWHHVLFPAFNDPSFTDFLYNKLNYYACKNGFKYTINVALVTTESDHAYNIDNYCVESDIVETTQNSLKASFFQNEKFKTAGYGCVEHTASNGKKFFVDHLMHNSTVIQLKDTPKVIKSVRVYQHLNHEPYLIVFVDYLNKLYHYKFQNGEWKDGDNIILLLDKTSLYEKSLVTSVLASATPSTLSESNYEHQPNEVNVLLENSTPLQSSGFKCYSHSIQPNGSSESLQLRVLVPTSAEAGKYTEISFYNDDKTKRDFIYYLKASGNDNNNKLYTYYSAPGNQLDARPMLLCYGGEAYRPHSLDKYFEEWVRVTAISHCEALVSGSEVNKLIETLVQVSELLNPVNIKLSGQAPYTVHTFNGTAVQNVISKTFGTSVTGCRFCYDKYVHTAKPGYRLGNVSYDASCIKFGTNERDAKCISATTAVNPYTTAEEVVTYYFKDDADFSVPLLVAVKNDNSYRPYYILKSNTGPAKLYQKVDEQIDLANFEALGEKLNQIRYDCAKTLQVIIGNRQGDGGSKTYRGKIYEVSGRQVQGGPTLPITLSDPVELPGEGEFKWFKYYEHRLDGETGINAIGGLRLFLRDLGPNNVIEIKLHSDANGLTPMEKLFYNTCKGNIYTYFYGDRDIRPLLICYNNKAYRPMSKETYNTKWVRVNSIDKCPSETSDNTKIFTELDNVVRLLNVIKTHAQAGAGKEHSKCKLFNIHRHNPIYSKAGDIEICKDENCSNKVVLTDGDYKNHTVLYEEMYYNRYDSGFKHPIMLVLHYEGPDKQEQKRYYQFSGFEQDKAKPKDIFELPMYPSESDFLLKLIDENDIVLNSVIYQIDKKDNSYNSERVTVTVNPDFPCPGFIQYVHRPKEGHTEGKSYILNKQDILLWWDDYNSRAGPINDFQNIRLASVNVYYSPKFEEPLLLGFEKMNGNKSWEYYFHERVSGLHWQVVDYGASVILLNLLFDKRDVHNNFAANNNQRLIQSLKKIEYLILKAISLFIDRKADYNKSAALNWLLHTSPQVLHYPQNISSQPENITVTEPEWKPLKDLGYKVFEHHIDTTGLGHRDDDKVELRVFLPCPTTSGKHTEVMPRKPEAEITEDTLTLDLGQQNVNVAYRGGKYDVRVSKNTFANNSKFVSFTHRGSSNEKMFEGDFTLKYKDMGAKFNGDLEDKSENQRIDVYFHSGKMDKFVIAAFPLVGGKKAKYFTYNQFISYYLSGTALSLSSLSEVDIDLSESPGELPATLASLLEGESNKVDEVYFPNLDVIIYKPGHNNFYTYYYGDDQRPLLICYNGSAYRPMKLGDPDRNKQTKVDYTKWYRVSSVTNCVCDGNSSNEPLIRALSDVVGYLNPVQLNPKYVSYLYNFTNGTRIKLQNDAYYELQAFIPSVVFKILITSHNLTCFRKYRYVPNGKSNNGTGFRLGNIVYDEASKQHLVFNYDNTKPLSVVSVYYHLYDGNHSHPLLVVLGFNGEEASEYYKLKRDIATSKYTWERLLEDGDSGQLLAKLKQDTTLESGLSDIVKELNITLTRNSVNIEDSLNKCGDLPS
ncbi:hypothetical protein MACK_003143 [Theileria orientalis]|uniref:Uncharacterized protein n=1 Tax=Theileria orientalis TaxID=68886 RepID=A0A976QVZ2_THEOR|nr:hypothetical protein MACK_003143 [Theileria orientalis]